MVQCPKVNVYLKSFSRPVDVLREGFDIAVRVRFGPIESSDLVMKPLGMSRQSLVASPALRGVGVVALPLLMIREELEAGTLVDVGAPWQPESGSVHAVFPSRRGLLPGVRDLLDFMNTEYREVARREHEAQMRQGRSVPK